MAVGGRRVVGSVILDGRGDIGGVRGWVDGEVVIAGVAGGARNGKERRGLWEAWRETWRRETSVVVVVGRGWGAAEGVVPFPTEEGEGCWVVLGQFRVGECWVERLEGAGGEVGGKVMMVKLQKADLGEVGWWVKGRQGMVENGLPLEERRFWGDKWDERKRRRCGVCGEMSPRVYRECWVCCNEMCGNFWREGVLVDDEDGRERGTRGKVPERLKFCADFLMARKVFDVDMRASWALVPDLQGMLRAWKGGARTELGTVRMRWLWRGMVCPLCKCIVPTVQWGRWECENERCPVDKASGGKWFFDFDIGQIPLQAVVPRTFVSWEGHPLLEPRWADPLNGNCEYPQVVLIGGV